MKGENLFTVPDISFNGLPDILFKKLSSSLIQYISTFSLDETLVDRSEYFYETKSVTSFACVKILLTCRNSQSYFSSRFQYNT